VGSCRFKQVLNLDFTHEQHVLLEYTVDRTLVVIFLPNLELKHAENKDNKVQLVSSSIIYTLKRAKRLLKIYLQFGNGSGKILSVRSKRSQSSIKILVHLLNKSTESLVTEAHWLFYGRNVVENFDEFIKPFYNGLAVIGDLSFCHWFASELFLAFLEEAQ
jgi:hypothetical protein